MKLFRIKGGVHPEERKDRSADRKIEPISVPNVLRIFLQQHIGAPAVTVVDKGDTVKKGQLLAHGRGPISASVHAPTSGRIVAISRFIAPHASGLPGQAITMRPDGEDAWGELLPPLDPFQCAPSEIAERVSACGIVGMGGATFPSAVKLGLGNRHDLETLVVNAAECEPYLTCDDRLMRERGDDVIDGVRIIRRALGVEKAIVAVEANKPEAFSALKRACWARGFPDVEIVRVPTQYPMGSEKHLVQTLTGKETPARALTADIGVVVHNVATCYAVQQAVRHGRPLISRIVTVSGDAVREAGNFEVPIGTPISHVLDHCGGLIGEPARLLLGGPMMGQPVASTRASIVKGSNGVIALTEAEVPRQQESPCIRCTSCLSACPCGLTPFEMAGLIKNEELDAATRIGLLDCIGCGSCAWVCPASIPLVQYFNYAKGKLTSQQRAKHKQEETKRLTRFRDERMEKLKIAKQEAMARMKAEREAKKKAKEAAEKKATEAAGEKVGA